MDVGLDLEIFDDGSIQMMRIAVSLLTLGIAFATNDRYGPGWNWLINLTFFECIIPVFLGNFGSEMVANLLHVSALCKNVSLYINQILIQPIFDTFYSIYLG